MIGAIFGSAPVWIANAGTAIFAYLVLIKLRWIPEWPVDGGLTLSGKRLIGDSRTVFGSLFMLLCAAGIGWLQGHWLLGLQIGLFGYMGTLVNSFIKRRLAIPIGESFFLDHIDYAITTIIGIAIFHLNIPGFNAAWFLVWVFVFQFSINAIARSFGFSSKAAHQAG